MKPLHEIIQDYINTHWKKGINARELAKFIKRREHDLVNVRRGSVYKNIKDAVSLHTPMDRSNSNNFCDFFRADLVPKYSDYTIPQEKGEETWIGLKNIRNK